MVQYSCDRCGKTFDKKQGLTQHMKRKTPCENIMEKVEEKKIDSSSNLKAMSKVPMKNR